MCLSCPHERYTAASLARFQVKASEPLPPPGNPPSYPAYLKPIPINTRPVLPVLEGLLNKYVPGAARFLYSTWTAEESALKYQEISNAIRDGEFAEDVLTRFRLRYAAYVTKHLEPVWRAGIAEVAAGVQTGRLVPSMAQEYTGSRIAAYLDRSGGKLIKYLEGEQRAALRAVVRHYTVERPVSTEELARYLRPLVGLTKDGAARVVAYRDELLDQVRAGQLKPARAEHLVQNYSHFLERRRANVIAVTETTNAFNDGSLTAVQDAQAQGYFPGDVVKQWLTREDERVCSTCGPLDGKTAPVDQPFPGGLERPGAHPVCRCALVYEALVDTRDEGAQAA
jgi:SPP1 gp7 family putative phage head morphogenesis protein